MLAEQSQIAPKILAALEDMRTVSGGELSVSTDIDEVLRRYIRALTVVALQVRSGNGVDDACVNLHRHFSDIRKAPRVLTPGEQNLLAIWPDALAVCFDEPGQDHCLTLGRIMAECGIPEDATSADATSAEDTQVMQPPVASTMASNDTEDLPAQHYEHVEEEPINPEVLSVSEAVSDSALSETEVTPEWVEATESLEAADPFTNVLNTLHTFSALVAEGAFSQAGMLSQDDILRYLTTLMELRDNAALAGLGRLTEACDALLPMLVRIMEADGTASRDDCEALSGFPLHALDLTLAFGEDAPQDNGTAVALIEPLHAHEQFEQSTADSQGEVTPEWVETTEPLEAADPFTNVLNTLHTFSALVAEGAFSQAGMLSQDDILRYLTTLMELRDNAALAGLGRLTEACDALLPMLVKIMEADGTASRDDCEALSGFPLHALDLTLAFGEDAPQDNGTAVALAESLYAHEQANPSTADSQGEVSSTDIFGSTSEENQNLDEQLSIRTDQAEIAAESATPIQVDAAIHAGAQLVGQELLGLLSAELVVIGESLQPVLSVASEPAARRQACEESGEVIERLGHAAESVGLTALSSALEHLSRNLRAAATRPEPDLGVLMPDVLGRIDNYLTHPTDISACAGLVDVLADQAWRDPLTQQGGFELVEKLANVVVLNEPAMGETRAEHASAEDVALDLPHDINPLLLENLLLELPQQMGAFTEAIGRIASGSGNLADVETAKRAAHTLKGAANTVGVKGIANLTHHLEDILIAYSDQNVLPGRSVAPLLLRAGDCLEAMNETLQGIGAAPDDAQSVLQDVLDCANRLDLEGLPIEEAIEMAPSQQSQPQSHAPTQQQEVLEQVSMLRIPAPLIDELLRLVGETITTNAQTQERLRLSIKQTQAVKAQNHFLHQLVSELDNLIDIRGAASSVHSDQDHGDFDGLEMERYTDLHTVKNRLVEAVTDIHELSTQSEVELSALGEVLEVQSRLQLDSQNAVMRTRMVRVETIVSRLQRGVRQAARLLDKNVTLDVKGSETLIDGGVLNDLIDPLMHVLRNAVDHGIEDAETRLANGKDAAGHIELSFVREGNAIAVRCRDDGRGLDMDAIRTSALQRGLIDSARVLSDDEMARLILLPGFSTRSEATQVSGRGIGMDVVQSRIHELKGSLTLHSNAGRGLNMEIRIPLSMLSTHALLVRIKDRMVALSTRNIEDIHYATSSQIKQMGIQWHYLVNDIAYDVVRLDALLNLSGDQRTHERAGFPLLLVRQSDGVVRAIEVQEIVDSRNLVMKSLGHYVPSIRGVAGAAILGDGSVVPVIDLPDLLRAGSEVTSSFDGEETERDLTAARSDGSIHLAALVVDDSLSARRAAAQVMKDAGFVVRTAIDGLEAVTILENFTPDIILADMEMPRMNGMELTSHVRGQSKTHNVPVIMITSRSTEKHRKQAQAAGVSVYLTKPFDDEILLRHVSELIGASRL